MMSLAVHKGMPQNIMLLLVGARHDQALEDSKGFC